MKKRLMIAGSIVLLALIVFFVVVQCFSIRILWLDVERVELQTDMNSPIVLDKEEARKAIRLYNRGIHGGEIYAEPGTTGYRLNVCFKDGSVVYIGEGITKHEKMIVSGAVLDRYYVKSQALIDYVHELIEKYGMTYE